MCLCVCICVYVYVYVLESHPLLLDGDVGQVNEKVVHLSSTVVVLHRAEPGG